MNVPEMLMQLYINRISVSPNFNRKIALKNAELDLVYFMEEEDRMMKELRSKFEQASDTGETVQ